MPPIQPPLAVIGGGAMASAILAGALAAHAIDPARVIVADPDSAKHDPLAALGLATTHHAADAIARLQQLESVLGLTGQILLASKPQSLPDVARSAAGALQGPRRVLISILAGPTSELIQAKLGAHLAIVRVMPNTPAQIRRGMSAIALGAGATPEDSLVAERLFTAVGEVIRIDESLMDAYTALAGSGPAYLFYVTEALERAAQDVGFDPPDAARIVRATLAGAALLTTSTGEDPATLRARVTSKGGTTAAGLAALEQANVADALVAAVRAARDRGAELAKLADA